MQIKIAQCPFQFRQDTERAADAHNQRRSGCGQTSLKSGKAVMDEIPVAARNIRETPEIRLDDEKRQNWMSGANRSVKRRMVAETQVALEPDDLSARRSHALFRFIIKHNNMARDSGLSTCQETKCPEIVVLIAIHFVDGS